MKYSHGLKPRTIRPSPDTQHPEAGFTLIEVMVSIAILTLIGLAIWSTFAGGMEVMMKIPKTGNGNALILQTDRAFRSFLGEISLPFWVGTIEINPDDDILEFPYFKGYADNKLLFYTKREYNSVETFLFIEGNSEDMDKDLKAELGIKDFKLKFGPFSKVSYDYVTDKDDNLKGATLTFSLLENKTAEITLYANIGGTPFWRP